MPSAAHIAFLLIFIYLPFFCGDRQTLILSTVTLFHLAFVPKCMHFCFLRWPYMKWGIFVNCKTGDTLWTSGRMLAFLPTKSSSTMTVCWNTGHLAEISWNVTLCLQLSQGTDGSSLEDDLCCGKLEGRLQWEALYFSHKHITIPVTVLA